jgi:hypothetical protein
MCGSDYHGLLPQDVWIGFMFAKPRDEEQAESNWQRHRQSALTALARKYALFEQRLSTSRAWGASACGGVGVGGWVGGCDLFLEWWVRRLSFGVR